MALHPSGRSPSPLPFALSALACLGLTGCAAQRSARVPIDSLPVLAESARFYPDGWHEVTTLDQGPRLPGKLLRVHIVSMGPNGPKETVFEPPFTAQLWDPEQIGVNQMVVTHALGQESYSTAPGTGIRVTVDYFDDYATRRNRGLGFVAGGVGAAGASAYMFTQLYDSYQNGHPSIASPFFLIFGTLSGGTALSLTGIGTYHLVTDPEPPNRPEYGAVAVKLGPGAASVEVSF
jgi:hypothetical protein